MERNRRFSALRRCYFIGCGAPVDLGRRRRRAPARRPRLIGGGVAGKYPRRRRRLVINQSINQSINLFSQLCNNK